MSRHVDAVAAGGHGFRCRIAVRPEEDAPVRRAHRYLRNRLDQVDYKGAAERELPIGSGQIESSHRHVVQARLKRPGAWWSGDNIDSMLSLRLCRANDQWDEYWAGNRRKAG